MNLLSLDIGRKHTGVAYCDASVGIVLPLDTIDHKDDSELVDAIQKIITNRKSTSIILGLPLMPDGSEGEEVAHVRNVSDALKKRCPECFIEFIDERLTNAKTGDDHAGAAVTILNMYLERSKR